MRSALRGGPLPIAVALSHDRRPAVAVFGRELAWAAAGALLYFLIRGAVVDRVEEAFARAEDVIALERSLGIFWERTMQEWILSSPPLIDLMNLVYFWLHMPLIIVVALWLFWRHRELYRLTRNAFLGAALIALVMYATLPLAPPRFFPERGFIDTMAIYSETSYQAQEAGPFVNPYAALPSLHFGWALLLGVALWRACSGWRLTAIPLRTLAILTPAAQFFAIVLTGNHFLIDAVAGMAVAAVGLAAALLWQRWSQDRQRAEMGPAPLLETD